MSPLLFEKHGPIATLTLNRPARLNVLAEEGDGALFADMAKRINVDGELRCVILTGAGSAFSAGGNVKQMRDKSGMFAGPPETIRANYRDNVHPIVRALWEIEVPLIAAVNGPAVGLGNDVACLADIRIAADTANFGASFLRIGLVPGDGGAWLLPRIMGSARAAEMLFTAEIIDAKTALAWGLVSKVVAPDRLMDEARALTAKIARQPPGVLRMTKKLLREGMTADFETIMARSAEFQALAHASEDHAEALAAFFEKRDPVFKGR
jgi:enoyl-CoA hydratase/carnithine racemase